MNLKHVLYHLHILLYCLQNVLCNLFQKPYELSLPLKTKGDSYVSVQAAFFHALQVNGNHGAKFFVN